MNLFDGTTRKPSYSMLADIVDEAQNLLREVNQLRADNAELLDYRDKYMELLSSSINHNRDMVAGLMQVAMTPGVLGAIAAHNESKDQS